MKRETIHRGQIYSSLNFALGCNHAALCCFIFLTWKSLGIYSLLSQVGTGETVVFVLHLQLDPWIISNRLEVRPVQAMLCTKATMPEEI